MALRSLTGLFAMTARTAPRGVSVPVRALHVSACLAAKMPGPLNDAAIAQFHKDGFIHLNDFLSPEEKKQIVAWTNELQSWPESKGKWMEYFEQHNGERMLCRTENFLDYHPPLREFITVKLNEAVTQLFGEESILFKEKINFKLPGGAGFKAHQDAPAWTTFDQKRHITAMVAVDKSDLQNGCMWMVKGEHLKGTFPHPDGHLEEKQCQQWKWHPMPCEVGDIAFFDSYTPHRSFDNKSNRSRRVFYITYNPKMDGDYRAAYYEDKRKAFPPDIEREPGKDYSAGGRVYNVGNPIPNKTM
jgi:hypothetical protein